MARNKYAVARRSIWYVLRTLLVTAAIVALCLGVFITGMHVSNLYIIANEGMELRAECVLREGARAELTEYFTWDQVEGDYLLESNDYEAFTITDYNYKLAIESLSVLPWSNRATFRVTERVSAITGSENDTAEGDEPRAIPEWKNGRYQMEFTRDESGRWYISDIIMLELNPETPPRATPDMSLISDTDTGQ